MHKMAKKLVLKNILRNLNIIHGKKIIFRIDYWYLNVSHTIIAYRIIHYYISFKAIICHFPTKRDWIFVTQTKQPRFALGRRLWDSMNLSISVIFFTISNQFYQHIKIYYLLNAIHIICLNYPKIELRYYVIHVGTVPRWEPIKCFNWINLPTIRSEKIKNSFNANFFINKSIVFMTIMS